MGRFTTAPQDRQVQQPVAACANCRGEVYGRPLPDQYGSILCDECRGELDSGKALLKYADSYRDLLVEFLGEFQQEDFLAEFWSVFREYAGDDYEIWARTGSRPETEGLQAC